MLLFESNLANAVQNQSEENPVPTHPTVTETQKPENVNIGKRNVLRAAVSWKVVFIMEFGEELR